jgi:hypothetical protein
MPNIDVVRSVCRLLDELRPVPIAAGPRERLITYVTDRPGHDRRYAIDARKIAGELGWTPAESFASGIAKTVRWYLANEDWVRNVQSGAYREWVEKNYGDRKKWDHSRLQVSSSGRRPWAGGWRTSHWACLPALRQEPWESVAGW